MMAPHRRPDSAHVDEEGILHMGNSAAVASRITVSVGRKR